MGCSKVGDVRVRAVRLENQTEEGGKNIPNTTRASMCFSFCGSAGAGLSSQEHEERISVGQWLLPLN